MFWLNFLPSDGEKRLLTLNVEASDNNLVSIHVFYPLGAQKSVLVKTDSFPLTSTNSMSRPLTVTVSRLIDGPRHDKLKTYCQSLPELLLLDLFDFIEKPFEMASRRNDSVVKGSKSHQTCSAWTLYPLSVRRDLRHWMLRPLDNHLVSINVFYPLGGQKLFGENWQFSIN